MVNIFGYVKESINEGDGIRSVLFFSGCHGMCDGCHNPESWSFDAGYEFTDSIQQRVINDITSNRLVRGVTYCGGEPFMSPGDVLSFTKKLKHAAPYIDVWSYTGYRFEDVARHKDTLPLLKEIDVLIDGRFIASKKDLTLKFRGSSNQRVIDVQQSLRLGKVVLYDI